MFSDIFIQNVHWILLFGPFLGYFYFAPRVSLYNSVKSDEDLNELWYNCFSEDVISIKDSTFFLFDLNTPVQLAKFLNAGSGLYRTWLIKRTKEGDIIGFGVYGEFAPGYKNAVYVFIGLPYRGQGYASESLMAMLGILRIDKVSEVSAFCDEQDSAFIRFAEKWGFQQQENEGFGADGLRILKFNIFL